MGAAIALQPGALARDETPSTREPLWVKVVLIGMPQEPAPIDIVEAQCKEIEFLTIFRYANVYDRAIKYIASGQINVKPLITHRFDLKDVVKAFEFASTMPGDAIKIMVKLPD